MPKIVLDLVTGNKMNSIISPMAKRQSPFSYLKIAFPCKEGITKRAQSPGHLSNIVLLKGLNFVLPLPFVLGDPPHPSLLMRVSGHRCRPTEREPSCPCIRLCLSHERGSHLPPRRWWLILPTIELQKQALLCGHRLFSREGEKRQQLG